MKTLTAVTLALCTATSAFTQGTLFFDQESSTDETFNGGGASLLFYGSVGQSFTPSLSSVGFIRLRVTDGVRNNGIGGTLSVSLRANAINGMLLGTSSSVALSDNFNGSVNFVFPTAVPVTPGIIYYFQATLLSGDDWGLRSLSQSAGDSNYIGGVFYGGNQPFSGADLWFREGIIVPEPTVLTLLVGGCGLMFLRRA